MSKRVTLPHSGRKIPLTEILKAKTQEPVTSNTSQYWIVVTIDSEPLLGGIVF